MNEESRAMRDASERARESERGILPSSSHRKTLLRWHAQAGTHTHLTLDRSAAWLAGCTAGFQAGSTLARTHIYIKPLSAYGRTIGRPVGRSVCEREGGETDGVISFAPNVHVAAAVAGGRANRHGRSYK